MFYGSFIYLLNLNIMLNDTLFLPNKYNQNSIQMNGKIKYYFLPFYHSTNGIEFVYRILLANYEN